MGLSAKGEFAMISSQRILHWPYFALALMVIAASASACMQEELPGDETGIELEVSALPEQPDELAGLGPDPEMDPTEAASGDQGLSILVEDGTQGQPEDPTHNPGCSYVKWCNEPGYWGTVCVQTGCSFDAAWAECEHEARVHVCGTIHHPMRME
jgi:hypothetical protein